MKLITIEHYNQYLKVFTNKRELNKYLLSMYGEDDYMAILSGVYAYAMHYSTEKGLDFILYLPSKYNESLLDHELIHITWFVGKALEIPVTFKHQEFQAYLFTQLKDKIKKQVYGRGKKVSTK